MSRYYQEIVLFVLGSLIVLVVGMEIIEFQTSQVEASGAPEWVCERVEPGRIVVPEPTGRSQL